MSAVPNYAMTSKMIPYTKLSCVHQCTECVGRFRTALKGSSGTFALNSMGIKKSQERFNNYADDLFKTLATKYQTESAVAVLYC